MTDEPDATALFTPAEGDVLQAHESCRGPWDEGLMHGGAPSALLARAVEQVEGGEEMIVTRLTVEFLSGVPLGPVEVSAQITKPGKRFQLVEATLHAAGRPVLLARAVRLRRGDDDGAAVNGPMTADRLPPPEDGEVLPRFVPSETAMFYPDAMEISRVRGELGSGSVAAWFRMRRPVVPGETPSPLSRACAASDFTNGLSWILPWDEWTFVNTDLSVHLGREPEGEWIGLEAHTQIARTQTGLARGVLHDTHGPFGTCEQMLFVARR